MRRLAFQFFLISLLAGLAGCGLGAGPAPSAVKLLVTSDFGARTIGPQGPPRIHGQETYMSLLERNHHVTTRFGGGFVQSIEGLTGGSESGRPVDWFYYVNGVEARQGAASGNVAPGDHIWWDHHDWSQTENIPAVVGSYPEPFLNGLGGKRFPVRVECAAQDSACRMVTSRLREAHVPAAVSAIGSGGEKTLRILVGPWAAVRREPGAASIERGPRASGVYARMAADGSSLTVLDAQGQALRTLRGATGLVAATRQGEDAPVWIVTGTDEAGVQAAAGAFDEASLARRFAVLVSAGQALALPARTVAGVSG